MTHSYSNPSEHVDTSGVESGVSKGEILDPNGFTIRASISDRECIYKCLDNCRQLAGLDRKQVERLCKEFEVEKTDEQIKNEYPPL